MDINDATETNFKIATGGAGNTFQGKILKKYPKNGSEGDLEQFYLVELEIPDGQKTFRLTVVHTTPYSNGDNVPMLAPQDEVSVVVPVPNAIIFKGT